jgi:uncharacterized membrane protein YcaP (DUF421 family)
VFFDTWTGLGRVLIVRVLAHASLGILRRVPGKRTLSKMNAFDFIVTVALGSTLATVLLSKDVALAGGVLAFAVLVLLQFVVTWSAVRSRTLRDLVKSEPSLLYLDGRSLCDAMRRERITAAEIEAAVRQSGYAIAREISRVVLETDGSMSVLRKRQHSSMGTPPRCPALDD